MSNPQSASEEQLVIPHKSAIDPSLRFEIHYATSRLCLACG
jgi:hypothetical protein